MPPDVAFGIATTICLSLAAACLGRRVGQWLSPDRSVLFAESILLCLTFGILFSGRPLLVDYLPSGS
ncbi:MAG: hypothetical protein AAGA03_15330, partial [Planctomycetota bacterium]